MTDLFEMTDMKKRSSSKYSRLFLLTTTAKQVELVKSQGYFPSRYARTSSQALQTKDYCYTGLSLVDFLAFCLNSYKTVQIDRK